LKEAVSTFSVAIMIFSVGILSPKRKLPKELLC